MFGHPCQAISHSPCAALFTRRHDFDQARNEWLRYFDLFESVNRVASGYGIDDTGQQRRASFTTLGVFFEPMVNRGRNKPVEKLGYQLFKLGADQRVLIPSNA